MNRIENIEIIQKIGEGGTSFVFKVFDLMRKKEVALKILKDANHSKFIKREFGLLKKIQGHESIPLIYNLVINKNFSYYTMDILGSNLGQFKKYSVASRFNYLTSMLNAIEHIHSKGVIHQDIKPTNFVLSTNPVIDQRVFLIDLGLADIHFKTDGTLLNQKNKESFVGTLNYASLNAHLKKGLGRKDDIYSFFFILLEFLDIELPWSIEKIKNYDPKNVKTISEVLRIKESCLANPKELLCGSKVFSQELCDFLAHLETLKYEDCPNYSYLRALVEKIKSTVLRDEQTEAYDLNETEIPFQQEKKLGNDEEIKNKTWTISDFFNASNNHDISEAPEKTTNGSELYKDSEEEKTTNKSLKSFDYIKMKRQRPESNRELYSFLNEENEVDEAFKKKFKKS